jgi:DNA-binding response OmpR family regulator
MQAWQILQQREFPVLISDWVMPELDGLELIRRIRGRPESSSYIYTILITARAHKEDLVEAMESGADDFISKPFDRDELRVRLRAGERYVNLEQRLAAIRRELAAVIVKLEQREPNEVAEIVEELKRLQT